MTVVASKQASDRQVTPEKALLSVQNLRVAFGDTEVVKGISFTARPGSCLAIVGESGSGKSVTARTLVGLTGGDARVEADRLELDGTDLADARRARVAPDPRQEIGFVLQDALVSLDQLRRVGAEVGEPLRLHSWGDRRCRRRAGGRAARVGRRTRAGDARAAAALRAVRRPAPAGADRLGDRRSTRGCSSPTSRPPRST